MELQHPLYDTAKTKPNSANSNNSIGQSGDQNVTVTTPVNSPIVEIKTADRTDPIILQKTNHVSTVLLYGIPIVSLFIEGQERLCLAQISNTLLKQFSYNEIHNRRVALGITCVQCTPVQLEILRRAGAMPISSRRCGMITRREAERLCKSFLGDNAPPRLPDDFAFSVFHKCAWGCRGSFLPARYNSSRAKCIKCSYCGMFFSPNKFIFHSHRINVNDKYVQPDAANFNSWRRHMMLSGQPPEEITHAWEDVKAMFNGGTRKRVVSNRSSAISPSTREPSDSMISTSNLIDSDASEISQRCPANGSEMNRITSNKSMNNNNNNNNNRNLGYVSLSSPKRPRHHSHIEKNINLHAMSPTKNSTTELSESIGPAVLGRVDGIQSPCHMQSPTTTTTATGNGRTNSSDEMHLMPFSCSLMMDYMWQQHQKHSLHQHYQQQQHHQQQTTNQSKGKPLNSDNAIDTYDGGLPSKNPHYVQFPQCPYPWIKSSGSFSSATVAAAAAAAAAASQTSSAPPSVRAIVAANHNPWQTEGPRKSVVPTEATIDAILTENFNSPYKRPSLYNRVCGESNSAPIRGAQLHQFNASAFKPVLQHNLNKRLNDNVTTNSATYSAISMTIATQNIPKFALSPTAAPASQTLLPLLSSQLMLPRDAASASSRSDTIKESQSSGDEEEFHKISPQYCDDDDELVDIETTEEETFPSVPVLPHQSLYLSTRRVQEIYPSTLALSNLSASESQAPKEFEHTVNQSHTVANTTDEIDIDGDDNLDNYSKTQTTSSGTMSAPLSSIAALRQESVTTCEKNNGMYVPLHNSNMNSNSSNPHIQSKSESNNTDSSTEIIDEFPTETIVEAANIKTGTTYCKDDFEMAKFVDAFVPFPQPEHYRQQGQTAFSKFSNAYPNDIDKSGRKYRGNEATKAPHGKCENLVCGNNNSYMIANKNGTWSSDNSVSNFNSSEFWTIACQFFLQHPCSYELTTNLVSVQHSNSPNYSNVQYFLQQQQSLQQQQFDCIPLESREKHKRAQKRTADHHPTKRMYSNESSSSTKNGD